jgi:hypothetical protein
MRNGSVQNTAETSIGVETALHGLATGLTQFGQSQQRGVDSQGQLNGQFRRHNRGQDEGTLKEQLVAVPLWVLGACKHVTF